MGISEKSKRKEGDILKSEATNQMQTSESDDKEFDTIALAYFERLIADERKKPAKKQNLDLIDKCIGNIAEIEEKRSDFSSGELDQIIENALAKYDENKSEETDTNGLKTSRRRFLKRPILIAAILVLTLIIGNIMVMAAVPSYRNWFLKIIHMPVGSQIDDDGVTYIYGGRTQIYKDVEELCGKENLNILYPGELPEGVHIKNIQESFYNGFDNIFFAFDRENIYFSIIINYTEEVVPDDTFLPYKVNDLCTAYYSEDTFRNVYFAIIIYNNCYYSITAPDYDSLIFILDNLKGF